jgi:hypothetical protein
VLTILHRTGVALAALAGALALGAAEARASACGTDEFAGPGLGPGWEVLRPSGGVTVAGGRAHVPLRPGALSGALATAGDLVLRDAPAHGWTATARLETGALDAPGERAGLVLWRGEGDERNAFSTLTWGRGGTVEVMHTDGGVLALPPATGTAEAAADGTVLLRLRHDGRHVAAAWSADEGATWTPAGPEGRLGGPVRVGLLALGTGGAAAFDRFALSCGPEVRLVSSPERGRATLEVGFSAYVHDDRDDEHALALAWDFGNGTTGEGGHGRFLKYLVPGSYRPTLRATDSDGNATTVSTHVTVLADDPPCPAASDAFAGNALDTRWEVVRPVAAGLEVAGGRLWLRPYPGVRNLVLQPAPAGPWTMTATVEGDAALALRRPDRPEGLVTLPAAGGETRLRVVSDGGRPATFTALRSADGTAWEPAGAPFRVDGTGPLQAGLVAQGAPGSGAIGIEGVDVEGPAPCGAPDTIAPETSHVLAGATLRLAAVDDATGTGVARTELRVDGGPVTRYAGPIAVAGRQVVEYRSVDRAGNVEPFRRLALPADAPPRGGTGEPPAPPAAGVPPPAADQPLLRLLGPQRRRVALRTFARRGLRVRLECEPAAVARIDLRARGRTLARRVAVCDGRRTLRLRPRKGALRALRRADRPVRATLRVRAPGAPAHAVRVTLR